MTPCGMRAVHWGQDERNRKSPFGASTVHSLHMRRMSQGSWSLEPGSAQKPKSSLAASHRDKESSHLQENARNSQATLIPSASAPTLRCLSELRSELLGGKPGPAIGSQQDQRPRVFSSLSLGFPTSLKAYIHM